MAAFSKAALFKKIGYHPHEGQIQFHNSHARFRLANCGRRFGKSLMAARDLEPKLFLRDKNFWIVAPTYDLGEKEFRVIWQDLIVGQKLGQSKEIKKAYNKKQGNMHITFPWGANLEVRTADQPDNLVGDSLDWVIMSEAAKHKEDTWEKYIRAALSDRRGGADFPTTPEGYNWLFNLWMRGQDDEYPDWDSWKFPTWYNLEKFPGGENDPEIIELRRSMPPEAFAQEIAAEFGSFVGKIYHKWDVSIHVRNLQFNPAWPNYIAFDWGYTNPLAAVEFQIDPQDRIYIWRVHYKAYMTVPEHIRVMKAREQPRDYHINLCFGDAADPEAAVIVSQLFAPCVALPEAKTNWRDGIDLVSGFLEREVDTDEYGGPIYEPALFVDPSCKDVIHEFNNYKAPPNSNGRNAREIGLNQDDHALDALRYGLVHIYRLGATTHLWQVMDDGMANNNEQLRNYIKNNQAPQQAPTVEERRNSGNSRLLLADYAGTDSAGFFSMEGGKVF